MGIILLLLPFSMGGLGAGDVKMLGHDWCFYRFTNGGAGHAGISTGGRCFGLNYYDSGGFGLTAVNTAAAEALLFYFYAPKPVSRQLPGS